MSAVRPTQDGIRLRELPVNGKPVGQVYTKDVLESMESAEETQRKVGTEGEWLKVKTPSGTVGYVAAWFLKREGAAPVGTPTPAPTADTPAANITGMNLDNFHPQGTPDPARLRGIGWVRFGYNVSAGKGSEDINAAYNTYAPLAERYARAGYKVLFAFTHQTYGEGKNEFWPWQDMNREKWRTLTGRFADMMRRIAQQYAGKNIVHAFQIWNEQDAPIGAAASVPMSPENYAYLLSESIRAIKSVDRNILCISGGHTGGPTNGGNYARATIRAMHGGILPDGIAFHPYGRGTQPGTRYANWGHIDEEIKAYVSILPDKPVWITEWGCLDKEGDPPADIANYAKTFMGWIKTRYAGKVAAAMWYAWAMGMHNGYGLVGRDDQPLEPLYKTFLSL